MNNSSISIEKSTLEQVRDPKVKLRELETQLVRIIEAIRGIKHSQEWSTLKTEVFDGLTARLERDLREEAIGSDPNPTKLNRIAGELRWAKRFSDFDKFESDKVAELKAIRLNLYGKSES